MGGISVQKAKSHKPWGCSSWHKWQLVLNSDSICVPRKTASVLESGCVGKDRGVLIIRSWTGADVCLGGQKAKGTGLCQKCVASRAGTVPGLGTEATPRVLSSGYSLQGKHWGAGTSPGKGREMEKGLEHQERLGELSLNPLTLHTSLTGGTASRG